MAQTGSAPQRVCSLGAYIDLLERAGVLVGAQPDARDLRIAYATDDSRLVRPDTLFICKGAAFKREYLLQAIEAGAVAYVSKTDLEVPVPHIEVSDIRRAMARIADAAYDHPSGKLSLCAFTGTKGKTTSAYYLRGILDAQAAFEGAPATPYLSSVGYFDGIEAGTSKLTTPEPFELEQRVANAVTAGARRMVMEASSQALKYGRCEGMQFAVGAFTNIGEDHISPIEHPTFEDYFASKLKIFAQSACAVVNLDMDYVDTVLEAARACERVMTYSLEDPTASVYAGELKHTSAGITTVVRTPRFTCEVLIPTPVRFNVANAVGAIAVAEALGVDERAVVAGLRDVRIPGRMELYPAASGEVMGIVDYAHNGMSLQTLLCDVRENYPDRELAVVFGATGGKGVDRRQTMGAAAGAYADRIVITEDDPGPEDPADICRAIAQAVEAQGNHAWKIVLDRSEAIRTCVRETAGPAVIVVTGKGQETRMLRREGAVPCEADGVVLRRALDEFFS